MEQVGEELARLVRGDRAVHLEPRVETVRRYQTPKVDVRGAIFNASGEILLVREKSDGGWSMPGGWCDILESPQESIAREIREETGISVEVLRLAAVLDREISETGWFAIDSLPQLSGSRLTAKQVELVHARWLDDSLPTAFD